MPSERADVRFKLDPDVHERLVQLANLRGLTIGDLCEQVVAAEVRRAVHEATVAARAFGLIPAGGHESPVRPGDRTRRET